MEVLSVTMQILKLCFSPKCSFGKQALIYSPLSTVEVLLLRALEPCCHYECATCLTFCRVFGIDNFANSGNEKSLDNGDIKNLQLISWSVGHWKWNMEHDLKGWRPLSCICRGCAERWEECGAWKMSVYNFQACKVWCVCVCVFYFLVTSY